MRRIAMVALLLACCGGDTVSERADVVALGDVTVEDTSGPADVEDALSLDVSLTDGAASDVTSSDVPLPDVAVEDDAEASDVSLDVAEETVGADGHSDVEAPPVDTWVAPQVPGDQCDEALVIDAQDLPFHYDGDTLYASDDVSLGGGCATGGDIGAGAPDVIFSFTPEVTAHHVIGLNPTTVIGDSPAVIYVVETCEDAAFSCVGVSSNLSAGGLFSVYLEAGVTYAVVVDGLLPENAGGFSFLVEEAVCVIDCPGPECGKDGCGGFCGEGCSEEQACRPDGYCSEPELIEGNLCALPHVIEALPFATTGDTWYGTPESMFVAGSCPGEPHDIGAASNDHFYQPTVETTGLYSIAVTSDYDSAIYVVSDCADPSGSCIAGSDQSLSVESMEVYLTAGQVVTIVVDGYGNDENMHGIYTLQVSQACVASCEGKVCGSDGCTGSCGECALGDVCDVGQCVSAPQGDTCLDPFVIDDVMPITLTGDTTDFQGDLGYEPWSCPGMELGWGAGSNDVVYAFEPSAQDLYTITLNADFDSTLYVMTDCLDVSGSCLGADDQHPTGEVVDVWMYPGTTYFIVVDGYGNVSNVFGEYTLDITPACIPQCKFKECGPDGCGGVCGECDATLVCSEEGLCESLLGNSCADPYLIDTVPFTAEADSTGATNLMGAPYDACPEETDVRGVSSAEEVWAFTPTESGVYTANVTADFPVTIYTLTDCTLFTVDCFYEENPGPMVWYNVFPECGWAHFDEGQCVGLAESVSLEDAQVETRAYLEAGTTYFYVVDGNALNIDHHGPYTISLDGPCTPDCDGKVCGGDSCGLTCGQCSPDTLCDPDQQCITLEGNSCETPFVIPEGVELPVAYDGWTSDATNAYGKPYGICVDEEKKAGAGSRDEVYAFTPVEDGTYEITLEAQFQGILYVLTECEPFTSACFFKETLGHDSWTSVVDGCGGFPEEACKGALVEEPDPDNPPETMLEVELLAGETVYIIIDGLGGLYDTFGAYTITLDRACDPQCDGKACGDDGCGDVCGECPGGFTCDESGQCIDETFTAGNTCENPLLVETVPFWRLVIPPMTRTSTAVRTVWACPLTPWLRGPGMRSGPSRRPRAGTTWCTSTVRMGLSLSSTSSVIAVTRRGHASRAPMT